MTFKAYFKKEFLEAQRTNKIIILFMGFFFFAIATPPMLKLTPTLLEKQLGENTGTISQVFKMSAIDSVSNYLASTIPQISMLVLCLVLGGVICNEINKGNIILPLAKGADKKQIVLAKFTFYSLLMAIIIFTSTIVNVYYSFIIFEEEFPKFINVLLCSFNVYIYILLILASIFFISTFVKKSSLVTLCSMGISILFTLLSTFDITINPFNLITEGAKLNGEFTIVVFMNSVIIIIAALIISIYRFKKIEIES